MELPKPFIDKMTNLLDREAAAFFASYKRKKTTGLRVNPLKLSPAAFAEIAPFPLTPVPFCPSGFYVDPENEPGKHPFHQAGLYYMQEPSAMFVAEVVAPAEHEKVLDLSAAPGGKTTQLAGMLNNTGLLVANDIHPKRARALSENVERMGITNALVTNETPKRLAERFPAYFDKILVDAPCSGEGMFRKDPDACGYWSPEHVEACAARQKDILADAVKMLKPDGTLVYSTCTFSPEENEHIVEWALSEFPELEAEEMAKPTGVASGEARWTESQTGAAGKAARLWPHRLRGEGHFVAKWRKSADAAGRWRGRLAASNVKPAHMRDFRRFASEALVSVPGGTLMERKGQWFALPNDCPDLRGVKVLRPGWHLGEQKKGRFEPNHALAMGLKAGEAKHAHELPLGEGQWRKYLRGETLETGRDRGWLVVTLEGYPLGWGKEVKGTLKNFYPKGLRIPVR
ncbi:MAG TPA: RsmF rRNA methyltransferase first C-terminal domain-containing protein [Bacillales bacterium]|nr:RsmF rRNA methyltransferase first C-terminal domain-containing protein [Bacillales bacterium]